jgi:hypothetical protein
MHATGYHLGYRVFQANLCRLNVEVDGGDGFALGVELRVHAGDPGFGVLNHRLGLLDINRIGIIGFCFAQEHSYAVRLGAGSYGFGKRALGLVQSLVEFPVFVAAPGFRRFQPDTTGLGLL